MSAYVTPNLPTAFIDDLAVRLAHRVQLTTDGHKLYLEAVENAFGADIDYAMLIKLYGNERPGEARYSPAHCTGTKTRRIQGKPEHGRCIDLLRRAPEPHDANVHAEVHAANKWLLEEGREPGSGHSPALHALQLLPSASDTQERHPLWPLDSPSFPGQ